MDQLTQARVRYAFLDDADCGDEFPHQGEDDIQCAKRVRRYRDARVAWLDLHRAAYLKSIQQE